MNACMVITEPRSRHLEELMGFSDDETAAHITEQRGNRGSRALRAAGSWHCPCGTLMPTLTLRV